MQTFTQPVLDLAPEDTEPTWSEALTVIAASGLEWTRWPDSWRSSMEDYSAGWTGYVAVPSECYVHVRVWLWRRLLDITWQVDARRMRYVAPGRFCDVYEEEARVLLEDPTPAEALAATAQLGLDGGTP